MKGVAQLSGKLLARKGEAAPVGRSEVATLGADAPTRRRIPQSFGNRHIGGDVAQARRGEGVQAPHGSREMPHSPQENGKSRRYAFTLRLDTERHRQLRLLSARVNRSAQAILIDALDSVLQDYIETEQACACMRATAADNEAWQEASEHSGKLEKS